MSDISSRNFGLLIAYLIPGFILIWGLGQWSPDVAAWLAGADGAGPTIGGFLIISVASIAAGMTASAIRWALIDTIHHATGLTRPQWRDVFLHEPGTGHQHDLDDIELDVPQHGLVCVSRRRGERWGGTRDRRP